MKKIVVLFLIAVMLISATSFVQASNPQAGQCSDISGAVDTSALPNFATISGTTITFANPSQVAQFCVKASNTNSGWLTLGVGQTSYTVDFLNEGWQVPAISHVMVVLNTTPSFTPSPTETTPAPTETTPAPTETTPAPTETTPAPTETTPAPTETTPVPTTPVVTTVVPTETPIPTTPAPLPIPPQQEEKIIIPVSGGDFRPWYEQAFEYLNYLLTK